MNSGHEKNEFLVFLSSEFGKEMQVPCQCCPHAANLSLRTFLTAGKIRLFLTQKQFEYVTESPC